MAGENNLQPFLSYFHTSIKKKIIMRRQLNIGYVTPKANRSFRYVILPVWFAIIVLLTSAFGASKTLQVIERIEAQAPETAEGLRTLVQDFQMGRFGELLREVGGKD
jgi:hypothetical protein